MRYYILIYIPLLLGITLIGFLSGKSWKWSILGLVYIIIPLSILILFHNSEDIARVYILWCFIVVWSADIMSYLAGNLIKGPLLFKTISPNKTWSGFLSGVLFASLSGYLFAHFLEISKQSSFFMGLGCGLLVAIGDLFESWIKRSFYKKDSSNYIPGHGGFLDRLDGFLFAIVFVWLVFFLGWR